MAIVGEVAYRRGTNRRSLCSRVEAWTRSNRRVNRPHFSSGQRRGNRSLCGIPVQVTRITYVVRVHTKEIMQSDIAEEVHRQHRARVEFTLDADVHLV